jgi:hypothetical protein
MKLALAALAILMSIPAAHADGTPAGATLQFTITADFGTYADFNASFEMVNNGSAITCDLSPIVGPCEGGALDLIPGTLTFSSVGTLGAFTLSTFGGGGGPGDLSWVDSTGDIINDEFLAGNYWEEPGTYSPYSAVDLYCYLGCGFPIEEGVFTYDGSVIVTEVPEPKSSALLLLGMVGLLFCASFVKGGWPTLPH